MDPLHLQTCTVDLRTLRVVRADGLVVMLSAREAEVLGFLADRRGTAVDRDTLYAEIWGYRNAVLSRAVDALVRRLRLKIEAEPSDPVHLLTIHGEGYRFEPGVPALGAPDDAPGVSAPGVSTLVAVGRDPLEDAEPDLVRTWVEAVDRRARTVGGTALDRRGPEGLWSFATPAPAVAFCLAAVDAGASVGARGAAHATDDADRVRRMLGAASPGRVVLGHALYVEVAMASGIRDRVWRRLGGVRLTFDGAPERLVETGDAADPGLRGGEGNLSAPPNVGFGRTADHAAVLAHLAHARLVTLTGTGGVGKTRLASEIGVAWRAGGGGAWFCDLSACRTAGDVASTVARVLDIRSGQDLPYALGHLGGDLLVLDNAEQALDAVRETAARWALLDRGPSLLVTSRERLGLPGEEVRELAPLPTDDAVALFVARARALGIPEEAEPGSVRALVERLDGLPLAIELAAARSEALSPAEILVRLDRSLSALGRDPVRPARHVDLRSLVRWSWELLAPLERRVLAACCTFVGPFEPDAVVAVAGGPEDDAIVDALHALRRKGLLATVTVAPALRRMAPYAAVRAFVAEQHDPAETLALRDRHAAWFAQWGTGEREDALTTTGGQALLARMRADLPDLLAASDHAGDRDPHTAVRTFLGAARVLSVFGPFEPIEARVRPILASGLEPVRVQIARVHSAASGLVLQEVDEALRGETGNGRALWIRAEIASIRWMWSEAQPLLDRAVALLRDGPDVGGYARALLSSARCLDMAGRQDEAVAAATGSLALFCRRGDRAGECDARMWLARASARLGRFDRALEDARAAHDLAAELLNPTLRIAAVDALSRIDWVRDEPGPAVRLALGGLGEARRVGLRWAVRGALDHLAAMALDVVGTAEARAYLAAQQENERDTGWAPSAMTQGSLGTIALVDGEPDRALPALDRATGAAIAGGWLPAAAAFSATLGIARHRAGDAAGARTALDRAVALSLESGTGHVGSWRAWADRAVVRAGAGDPGGAAGDLAIAESLVVPRWAGHRLVRTKLDARRAQVALSGGDRETADRLARRVRAEVDRRGLGPTTVLGADLLLLERALGQGG